MTIPGGRKSARLLGQWSVAASSRLGAQDTISECQDLEIWDPGVIFMAAPLGVGPGAAQHQVLVMVCAESSCFCQWGVKQNDIRPRYGETVVGHGGRDGVGSVGVSAVQLSVRAMDFEATLVLCTDVNFRDCQDFISTRKEVPGSRREEVPGSNKGRRYLGAVRGGGTWEQ